MSKRVGIVSAVRTPIGAYMGSFTHVTAVELGIHATREALRLANIDGKEVDEFIYGNARQAASGPNPARQISFRSGMGEEVPAYTLNMACGSSVKCIALGAEAITSGEADIVVAGGVENMTRVPFMMEDFRWGYRMGHAKVLDGMYRDGLFCPIAEMIMGETAEKLADIHKISREEQDRYAVRSQNRAEAAADRGVFKDEIVPVEIKDRKGKTTLVETDEHPRRGVTMEKLAKLPPVFRKDGTITAGNSSGITDAAGTVVLMSEDAMKARGLDPLVYVGPYTQVGVDPTIMGISPVPACKKLFDKTGLAMDDFDLVELNEAFAAQVLAVDRQLPFDWEKTNVNGGAISLGHPIAMTGVRLVTTLAHEMKRRAASRGLVTLCISGGLGMAMVLER
jgi:acetyl-CoA C-acetyltransferase